MSPWLRVRLLRFALNLSPCIRGSGGRVTHIAQDYTRLTVKLPLSWRTRNAVGTIYGGSMYASTDPFFMLMLMRILGKDYVVWDKGCTIRFKRPAKETLHAEFRITPEMLDDVREKVANHREATFTWKLEYRGGDGTVYCEFDKVLYVAAKKHYHEKLSAKRSLGK